MTPRKSHRVGRGSSKKRPVCLKFAFLLPLLVFALQARHARPDEAPGAYPRPIAGETPLPQAPIEGAGGLEFPWDASGEGQAFPAGGGRAWDEAEERGFGRTALAALAAAGYCLASNGLVMLFNRFVIQAPWAFPTAASIRRNFTEPWKWEDTDGFKVNHIGHPLQGMTYFSAGRVMGFCFYGSIFFSAFGSFTWEAFGETQQASINDFYITTPTGLSLGEMMFSLYMQAHAAGVPAFVTFFINPTVGVHRLLTRWEPPEVERNLYELRFYLAAGYADTRYSASGPMVNAGGRREIFSHRGAFAEAGFRIVYGDPFVQSAWVPFRHFEFHGSFGTDLHRHNDFRLFSDGYLFSFAPVLTETRALSTGLSLIFDFASIGEFDMYDATINMFSNALAWTAKHRRVFSPGVGLRSRAHAGFTFFGASNYYNPLVEGKTELKNHGFGVNLRHISSLEMGRFRLDLSNFFLFQWSYPGDTSQISRGFVRWQFHDIALSYLVSPRVSLGASFSLATERGFFGEFPSTRKNHWSARTFVAWNGRNIRE